MNLFGHTHRTTGLWKLYGLNVGCDLNHFYLFSEDEIFRLLELKSKWWDSDVDNLDNINYRKSLKHYKDYYLADNINTCNFIGFSQREFYCLDNCSAFKIEYDGVVFSTVEHAYQAYKFKATAPQIFNKIVNSFSPYEARKIADQNQDKVAGNWNDVRLELMEKLLKAKLNQNTYVKEKLKETQNYIICYDDEDEFWGIGPKRNGENNLGKIWMKLRDEI